jgi:hypothetical protein
MRERMLAALGLNPGEERFRSWLDADGSTLGLWRTLGQISEPEHEAGRQWAKLLSAYHAAIGVRGIRCPRFQRGVLGHEPDPDSDAGRVIAKKELRSIKDYEDAVAVIGAGSRMDRALRRLSNEHALNPLEQADAVAALRALAQHQSTGTSTMTVNEDLLIGASAIAVELCGTDTASARRRVYHLHRERAIPTFKFAGQLAATRSGLRQYFDRKMQLASAA